MHGGLQLFTLVCGHPIIATLSSLAAHGVNLTPHGRNKLSCQSASSRFWSVSSCIEWLGPRGGASDSLPRQAVRLKSGKFTSVCRGSVMKLCCHVLPNSATRTKTSGPGRQPPHGKAGLKVQCSLQSSIAECVLRHAVQTHREESVAMQSAECRRDPSLTPCARH
jgi:hypothetical protein